MKNGYALLALGVLLGAALIALLAYLLGLDRAQQIADVANKLTLAAAAIVGGYWVYDRFVRERLGESRLDLTVTGEALAGEPGSAYGAVYVAVTVGAQNVGTEKVDLDHDYCALTVAVHEAGVGPVPSPEVQATSPGAEPEAADEAGWVPLDRVFFVLQEQDAIEPGASFGDQLLVRLPGKAPVSETGGTLVAVKLDLNVQSKDGGYWAATSVLAMTQG